MPVRRSELVAAVMHGDAAEKARAAAAMLSGDVIEDIPPEGIRKLRREHGLPEEGSPDDDVTPLVNKVLTRADLTKSGLYVVQGWKKTDSR